MDQLEQYIAPIKKRWIYHFIVCPRTNLTSKPEWYLNQTLKWIHEHIDSVENKIKLSQTKNGCNNVRHKFILSMVELAVLRLNKDVEKLFDNEPMLIHTYNEAILFSRVIRQLLGPCCNLEDKQDIMSVFYEQKLFERIVDIEWLYAEKNLWDITKVHPDKWELVLGDEFRDIYQIPRCVDRLMMQIQSITERIECFQQVDCQYTLIEMQCFLLNKFLSFLKKTYPPSNLSSDRRLNGANFLRLIIKERCFLKVSDLNKSLEDKMRKLNEDYREFCYKLEESIQ